MVDWNEECQQAFDIVKKLITSTAVLEFSEYNKPFKMHTDASSFGLVAVLYKTQGDGPDRVINYANRTLSKSKRKYSTSKLEFLALKVAVTE